MFGLLAMSFCFFARTSSSETLRQLPTAPLLLTSMILYIAFFATGTFFLKNSRSFFFKGYININISILILNKLGMGVLPWTINAEIFPAHLSGAANGVATTANWMANLIVSATFLSLFKRYPGNLMKFHFFNQKKTFIFILFYIFLQVEDLSFTLCLHLQQLFSFIFD